MNLLLLLLQTDNGPCLGWRESYYKPYQWLNYNEALLRAKNFGSGLVALGLNPSPETFLGLYSTNCPEWILAEQGAYTYSMVIVPLYDTLGPDACAYIVNQGSISFPVCSKVTKFSNERKSNEENCFSSSNLRYRVSGRCKS